MRTHELQSVCWREDGLLEVAYRTKSFFAGSSGLICESMDKDRFIELFGKKRLPPKPQK